MPQTIYNFYNGNVQLIFDEKKHAFFNNKTGEKIISVTEALGMINKPLLIAWAVKKMRESLIEQRQSGKYIGIPEIIDASKIYQNIKKEAADKGKIVHNWVETYIKNKIAGVKKLIDDMPEDDQVTNGIMAFLQWERETKIKWVASERKIYSMKHDYAGILDIKGMIGKHLHLVDIKTGNSIYNEMRFQTAAYQKADEEELGEKYSDERWIIRLDKNTAEFEAKPFDECNEDFESFLSALQLKKRDNKLSGKIKAVKPAINLAY